MYDLRGFRSWLITDRQVYPAVATKRANALHEVLVDIDDIGTDEGVQRGFDLMEMGLHIRDLKAREAAWKLFSVWAKEQGVYIPLPDLRLVYTRRARNM